MNKIGIICGDGNLPIYIGKSLIKKKFDVTFLLLNSVKNKKRYKNHKHIIVNILSIKKNY